MFISCTDLAALSQCTESAKTLRVPGQIPGQKCSSFGSCSPEMSTTLESCHLSTQAPRRSSSVTTSMIRSRQQRRRLLRTFTHLDLALVTRNGRSSLYAMAWMHCLTSTGQPRQQISALLTLRSPPSHRPVTLRWDPVETGRNPYQQPFTRRSPFFHRPVTLG
jgi:hypothetical protein